QGLAAAAPGVGAYEAPPRARCLRRATLPRLALAADGPDLVGATTLLVRRFEPDPDALLPRGPRVATCSRRAAEGLRPTRPAPSPPAACARRQVLPGASPSRRKTTRPRRSTPWAGLAAHVLAPARRGTRSPPRSSPGLAHRAAPRPTRTARALHASLARPR